MFLLHIVHTSAARTEPSACRNRLQRIMRPQQTGTHAVGVSSVMSHAHPGKVRECARLYTARPISLFPTHDGPCGIGTRWQGLDRCYQESSRHLKAAVSSRQKRPAASIRIGIYLVAAAPE